MSDFSKHQRFVALVQAAATFRQLEHMYENAMMNKGALTFENNRLSVMGLISSAITDVRDEHLKHLDDDGPREYWSEAADQFIDHFWAGAGNLEQSAKPIPEWLKHVFPASVAFQGSDAGKHKA